jgi:hypothetical protein
VSLAFLHCAGLHGAGRLRLGGLANFGWGRLLVVLVELGLLLPFVHLGDWITRAGDAADRGPASFVEGEIERAGGSL